MSMLPQQEDPMLALTSLLPTGDDFPLNSLDLADESAMPMETYMMHLDLIKQAMQSVKGTEEDDSMLPDYYDDMLMDLIDAVPLE